MTTQYTIVKYLSNPLSEECINIGIIAYNERNDVASYFASNLEKIKQFDGSYDISWIKGIINDFVTLDNKEKIEYLIIMLSWNNSIQLTEPRGSLEEDPKELIDGLADIFICYLK